MNKAEFMNELESLLHHLPDSERREALQYYNDYFDDAGPENEAQVIRELGSPARVAKMILEGVSENGEYTERGYEDGRFRDRQEISTDHLSIAGKEPSGGSKSPNLWKLLCILLLCLLLSPVLIPIGLIPIILIAVILACVVGVVIAAVTAAAALPIAGIAFLALAFYNLFASPAVGVTLGGIGCILLSAGILTFLLAIWICKILFPICIRGTVSLIRYPLRKAGILK